VVVRLAVVHRAAVLPLAELPVVDRRAAELQAAELQAVERRVAELPAAVWVAHREAQCQLAVFKCPVWVCQELAAQVPAVKVVRNVRMAV
jgi:hypothetical protein